MIVYRICQTYPPGHDPIDGRGAFKNGGRWNSKGTFAIYTASSLALARSELARHVNLESIPEGYRVYEIEVPDGKYQEPDSLPEDWTDDPPSYRTQHMGDGFLSDQDVLAIKVPSVCDPNSYNYILNPGSRNFGNVQVVANYPLVP